MQTASANSAPVLATVSPSTPTSIIAQVSVDDAYCNGQPTLGKLIIRDSPAVIFTDNCTIRMDMDSVKGQLTLTKGVELTVSGRMTIGPATTAAKRTKVEMMGGASLAEASITILVSVDGVTFGPTVLAATSVFEFGRVHLQVTVEASATVTANDGTVDLWSVGGQLVVGTRVLLLTGSGEVVRVSRKKCTIAFSIAMSAERKLRMCAPTKPHGTWAIWRGHFHVTVTVEGR